MKKIYSIKEIQVFKELLIKMKNLEEAQIENINQKIIEITENGKDENNLDNSSYSMQIDDLLYTKSRLKTHLNQIANALKRIEHNCYGICVETGKLIPKERLLAIPTTSLSIEGKLLREKKK